MQPHRSFLSCRDAPALVLASALLACTAHPAPDVALDMQDEVMPGPNESAVPSSPPARDAHVYLSPLLAAPADLSSSQPGSGVSPVTVLGERNLGGVWKFYMPQRLDVSLPGGFAYGRVATHLCRVVQHGEAISGNCLLDSVSPLSGEVLGSHLQLHLAGLTFSGRAVGWNRLQGAFALRVMGLGVTPPLPRRRFARHSMMCARHTYCPADIRQVGSGRWATYCRYCGRRWMRSGLCKP